MWSQRRTKMNMHPSWSDMALSEFGKTHGYCPLCATYHDLYTDSGLLYCIANDINLSGWDVSLYNLLATSPESVDINMYNDVRNRLVKNKLVRTLPIIIERRAALLQRIRKAEQPQTQEVKVVVQQPKFSGGYWNRVADYMGLP